MISVAELLNRLDSEAAAAALSRCCAARRFVQGMLAARPFEDDAAVLRQATAIEDTMQRDDWLEAFAAHPRIGDQKIDVGWSRDEQRGAAQADAATSAALEASNRAYEARFGHIFLICASGLDAPTMLQALERRLLNEAAQELIVAAGEQRKITRLRLGKLVDETTPVDGGMP